jgi:hypothetical protein
MFLVIGGLVHAAPAANPGASSYYATGGAHVSLSDDGEADTSSSAYAAARAEANALYVDHGGGGYNHRQVGYYGGGGGCGCAAPSCSDACGSGNWACGNGCECVTNTFRFEYLAWFTHGRNTPPLVTTGTPASEGIIGDPGTTILFGNEPITDGLRSGARLTFSHLFADGGTYGDVRFWGLEDGSDTFGRSSNGTPLLAIPFFDALVSQNNSNLIAAPGVATGSVTIRSKNDVIAADAWFRQNWSDDGCNRVDVLAGYMFSRIDDSLSISTQSTFTQIPPAGILVSTNDLFRTQNEFHGAQLGFLRTAYRGSWEVELLGKIAFGDMRQAVITSGTTTVTTPGSAPTTGTGGVFALPTNIGDLERHRFAVVPEVNLNLIYNINPCWRVIGGYSFVYWSNVVLAGNQIDPALNFSQVQGGLQGPAFPRANFARNDFWAQGMSLGLEYRW